MMATGWWRRVALVMMIWLGAGAALAAPITAEQRDAEIKAAWAAADKAAIRGPATVPLAGQGNLPLAKGQAFIPADIANRLMKAMGNSESSDRQGIVVGTGGEANWMIDIAWTGEGYVRDGDAKEWQADELLQSLKDGTEAQNEERTGLGLPALDIIGWIEPPAYDAATNRLVWSLAARERGAPADQPQTVNYNTYALGRNGYFSLDLLTDSAHVAADKAVARQILADLRFDDGKRYADFNSSTDKVAAFGLAALVGGVVLKKAGLLAVAGLFLLKVWKIALIALLGGFTVLRNMFRRRKPDDGGEAAAPHADLEVTEPSAPSADVDLHQPEPTPASAEVLTEPAPPPADASR